LDEDGSGKGNRREERLYDVLKAQLVSFGSGGCAQSHSLRVDEILSRASAADQ